MSGIAGLLSSGDPLESRTENTRGRWIFALLLVLITLAELFFAYRHSDFNNDDLDHFALAAKSSLLAYMATPVETIHIVPFHRLLTFIIYHIAPMNFMVALGLLGCIHAVTLYYLCRISRLLQAGVFGNVIVLCYALSVLNIFVFVWWASAAHRIPYLALSACAAYHYLASLREGAARRHAVMVVLAFLTGCGFYIKMVFVPFYLAAYGLVTIGIAGRAWRRAWRLPAFLVCGSIAYLLTYAHFVHTEHVGMRVTLRVAGEYSLALFGNLLGFTIDNDFVHASGLFNVWTIGVIGVWLAMLMLTLRRDIRIGMCWLLLFGITFLDFVPIAMSNRSIYFADIIPYSVRYHVDAQVIVAVLLLIIAAAVTRHRTKQTQSVRWIFASCTVLLYAVAMLVNLRSEPTRSALSFSNFGHAYMHNLRKGLRQIHDPYPSFVITPVPQGMELFGEIRTTDLLVPLLQPQARFDVAHGDYRVQIDGTVVPTGAAQ
jgi:hypothetical protein